MEARLKLSKQSMQPLVDATTYQSIIGILRYSWPWICCWVCESISIGVMGGSSCSGEADSLLCGGHHQLGGIWFGSKKGNHALLIRFSDADFAGDVDATKSTTGVMFFVMNNPVTWQSTKQRVVAQSSCESEYIATTNAMCQTL
jgi:hypothetical protein